MLKQREEERIGNEAQPELTFTLEIIGVRRRGSRRRSRVRDSLGRCAQSAQSRGHDVCNSSDQN